MAEEIIHTNSIPGYSTPGIMQITYKSEPVVGVEDGVEYQNVIEHSNKVNIFICELCHSAVLESHTDLHTAWHNPEASA
jgi:hypothetical protein